MAPVQQYMLRALLATSVVSHAFAQTIVVDGREIEANEVTIAPAEEIIPGTDSFVEETAQLTDAVLSNLTNVSLTDVSLLYFENDEPGHNQSHSRWRCKTMPGDKSWPHTSTWRVLDLVTGGSLIKTVPISAPCHDDFGVYDEARCEVVIDQWSNSSLHEADPTSVMSPLYQGLTCQPTNDKTDACTLGGFPSYVIDAKNVAHVQLAVNFARASNLRLVVKNTGHDFNGRSVGAGALSIWTHRFKGIKFYENLSAGAYNGPAMKVGAGVIGVKLYEAAEKYGVTAVGGEGMTVGYAGGYLAGGGHSPMSPTYGIAADSILSIDVVTPDGRFITASAEKNTDLFWALSGGGGSTFGVAISYTVKVYPKTKAAVMSFSITTSNEVSHKAFWEAIRAYFQLIPEFDKAGNYEYWNIFHGPDDLLMFNMVPWFAPGMTLRELGELTAPLFAKWKALGIEVSTTASEHDSFYPAWRAGFPQESVGQSTGKTAGRFFPKANWDDDAKFNATFAAIKGLVDKGGQIVGFGISSGKGPYPDNAVNPHWRKTAMFAISVIGWPEGSSREVIAEQSRKLTDEWMQPWRDAAPDSGSYASESDVTEPDFKNSYYGDKYERLLEIKDRVDPRGLFYALQGVGSDRWYVTGQLEGFPTQNGRLCPVGQ